jgi:hypothetical protein
MRVPDQVQGRRVQCPFCENVFRYQGQPDLTLGAVPPKGTSKEAYYNFPALKAFLTPQATTAAEGKDWALPAAAAGVAAVGLAGAAFANKQAPPPADAEDDGVQLDELFEEPGASRIDHTPVPQAMVDAEEATEAMEAFDAEATEALDVEADLAEEVEDVFADEAEALEAPEAEPLEDDIEAEAEPLEGEVEAEAEPVEDEDIQAASLFSDAEDEAEVAEAEVAEAEDLDELEAVASLTAFEESEAIEEAAPLEEDAEAEALADDAEFPLEEAEPVAEAVEDDEVSAWPAVAPVAEATAYPQAAPAEPEDWPAAEPFAEAIPEPEAVVEEIDQELAAWPATSAFEEDEPLAEPVAEAEPSAEIAEAEPLAEPIEAEAVAELAEAEPVAEQDAGLAEPVDGGADHVGSAEPVAEEPLAEPVAEPMSEDEVLAVLGAEPVAEAEAEVNAAAETSVVEAEPDDSWPAEPMPEMADSFRDAEAEPAFEPAEITPVPVRGPNRDTLQSLEMGDTPIGMPVDLLENEDAIGDAPPASEEESFRLSPTSQPGEFNLDWTQPEAPPAEPSQESDTPHGEAHIQELFQEVGVADASDLDAIAPVAEAVPDQLEDLPESDIAPIEAMPVSDEDVADIPEAAPIPSPAPTGIDFDRVFNKPRVVPDTMPAMPALRDVEADIEANMEQTIPLPAPLDQALEEATMAVGPFVEEVNFGELLQQAAAAEDRPEDITEALTAEELADIEAVNEDDLIDAEEALAEEAEAADAVDAAPAASEDIDLAELLSMDPNVPTPRGKESKSANAPEVEGKSSWWWKKKK